MSAEQLIELAKEANQYLSIQNQIGIATKGQLETDEGKEQYLNVIRVMTSDLPEFKEKINNLKEQTNETPEKPKRKRNTKPTE